MISSLASLSVCRRDRKTANVSMNAPSKTIRNNTEIVFIGLGGEKNPENRPGRKIQPRLRRVFWLAREGRREKRRAEGTRAEAARDVGLKVRPPKNTCTLTLQGCGTIHPAAAPDAAITLEQLPPRPRLFHVSLTNHARAQLGCEYCYLDRKPNSTKTDSQDVFDIF